MIKKKLAEQPTLESSNQVIVGHKLIPQQENSLPQSEPSTTPVPSTRKVVAPLHTPHEEHGTAKTNDSPSNTPTYGPKKTTINKNSAEDLEIKQKRYEELVRTKAYYLPINDNSNGNFWSHILLLTFLLITGGYLVYSQLL